MGGSREVLQQRAFTRIGQPDRRARRDPRRDDRRGRGGRREPSARAAEAAGAERLRVVATAAIRARRQPRRARRRAARRTPASRSRCSSGDDEAGSPSPARRARSTSRRPGRSPWSTSAGCRPRSRSARWRGGVSWLRSFRDRLGRSWPTRCRDGPAVAARTSTRCAAAAERRSPLRDVPAARPRRGGRRQRGLAADARRRRCSIAAALERALRGSRRRAGRRGRAPHGLAPERARAAARRAYWCSTRPRARLGHAARGSAAAGCARAIAASSSCAGSAGCETPRACRHAPASHGESADVTLERRLDTEHRDAIRDEPSARAPTTSTSHDTALYFNRELSWLDFNDRVLELAEDRRRPAARAAQVLRRSTRSNLDEFFMVRVAGLHEQVDGGIDDAARRTAARPRRRSTRSARGCASSSERQTAAWSSDLRPALAEHGIRIVALDEVDPSEQREALAERFRRQIFPVLTPLAVGLGRPFPYISNLSLSLAVLVRDPQTEHETFARVKVPKEMLPRFVPIGDGAHVRAARGPDRPAPRRAVPGHGDRRLRRLPRHARRRLRGRRRGRRPAAGGRAELRRRRFGEVVRRRGRRRHEPAPARAARCEALEIERRGLFEVDGLLDLEDLWEICACRASPSCATRRGRRSPSRGCRPTRTSTPDMIAAMRKGDILVHHPYDSFATSVERFVEQAVDDPDVLAIKQTVYRTSDDSPLVPALIRATERGKQAVCLVELKARFDERANISWARKLEEAGVHVVYGLPRAQDAREVHPRRAPRGRRRAPLRAHRHRQLPPEDGAAVHRLRPVHVRRARSAPTSPTCSTSSPASRRPRATARRAGRAGAHARRASSSEIERTIAAHAGGRARADRDEDELARRPALHPARSTARRRPACRSTSTCAASAACGRASPGVSENIRVVLGRRALPRALAHLRVRARRRARRSDRLGRPDAAQPRHARRAARAGARRGAARASCSTRSSAAWPTTRTPGTLGPDGAWTRREPSSSEPRNAQRELMARTPRARPRPPPALPRHVRRPVGGRFVAPAGAGRGGAKPHRITPFRCIAAALVAAALAAPAASAQSADVAALQVALRADGLYAGTVDGVRGPLTSAGVRRFQARRGLVVDGDRRAGDAARLRPPRAPAAGHAGARERGARLGRRRRCSSCSPATASRPARWTAASGRAPPRRCGASRPGPGWPPTVSPAPRRWRGCAGRRRRARCVFAPPVAAPVGDRFGPRGNVFHTGIDFPVPSGTTVGAAGRGCV